MFNGNVVSIKLKLVEFVSIRMQRPENKIQSNPHESNHPGRRTNGVQGKLHLLEKVIP
jgi:hypothetical protein